jgi:hypothetical protein
MWRDYFPNAEILGIDHNEESMFTEDRIRTYCGDQVDVEFLDSIPGTFDIIIDDGGHHEKQIVTSFDALWPRLNMGGYYVVEDMQAWRKGWPGDITNPWLVERIHHINAGRISEITSMHLYHEILFMQKGPGNPPGFI